MAKLIWPVLVLAGAILLATAPLTVSGTFDLISLLDTELDPNNATNNTRRAVFNANLNTLENLMKDFKLIYVNFYNKTLNKNLTALELPLTLPTLGFAQILPVFNQVAKNFVNIANNIRRNITTPPTNFSIIDFVNSTAAMVNISLDTFLMQLSSNSTPNATAPKVFGANLVEVATLLGEFVPIINVSLSAMADASVLKSIYLAAGASLPLVNDILEQLEPLLWTLAVPGNLTEVLGALFGQIGSITALITDYLPGNLTLEVPDPDWDYTCGTFFTHNLIEFNGIWNETSSALIELLNSTSAKKLPAVKAAITGVGVVLPILSNLTGQVGDILDELTPKYNRRLYPDEVRLNRYRSDCHLRHLQRVNGRRLH